MVKMGRPQECIINTVIKDTTSLSKTVQYLWPCNSKQIATFFQIVMALLFSSVAIAASISAAVSAFVWYSKPSVILRLMMRCVWYTTGARIKYINHKELQFCYAERGIPRTDTPTLVFIHGFSSNKDMWISILKKLDKSLHVVVVDLLGHGNSSLPSDDKEISVFRLADELHEMLTLAKLNQHPLHLVGTSMGGTVASCYASKYSKEVSILTLICPAMLSPHNTKISEDAKHGKSLLLADTVEGLDEMLDNMLYNKKLKRSNKQLLKGFLQLRHPKMGFFTALFKSFHFDEAKVEEMKQCVTKIHQPTQIIWGSDDLVINVSGAGYIQQRLPNCQRVDILSNCGHAVTWDQPNLTAEYILEFRESLDKKHD